jgi:hypothetical protein
MIHAEGPASYAIVRVDGERIGTSANRRDAMALACRAAANTDATVWLCRDPLLNIYTEVVCP